MTPFTLERYRIVELYAEVLHCSNMSLLNRPANYSRMYDLEGRLQGGLGGLEELAHVIALNGSYRSGGDGVSDGMDERDEIEPALDFPIHGASGASDEMLGLDDDEEGMMDSEDEPGSSDDEVMEEIVIYDEPPSDVRLSPLPARDDGSFFPSSSEPGIGVGNMASFSSTVDTGDLDLQAGQLTRKRSGVALLRSSPDPTPTPPSGLISNSSSASSTSSLRCHTEDSRRSSRSRRRATLENSVEVVGEFMKRKLLDEGVISMIVVSNLFHFFFLFFRALTDFPLAQDLFFQYPWNNFLHSAVYDFLHQVLTGRVDSGCNRELIISLFRDAKILYRIVDGQAKNDVERCVNYQPCMQSIDYSAQFKTKRRPTRLHGPSHAHLRRCHNGSCSFSSRSTSHHNPICT